MTLTILPGDSALFEFSTLADFSVTVTDSVFDVAAWVDWTGDNVQYNDTAYTDVESLHTPADPIVTSPVNVPYASPATLSAISPTGDTLLWYDSLIGGSIIGGGPTYTTPIMYIDDTLFVQAGSGSGMHNPDSLTTTFASNNGQSGNMFDITAFTTITIDSFYMNCTSSSLVEVWYRPGTYVGHTSLEAEVQVIAENPISGEQVHTNTAYLVYVALDDEGNPTQVPTLYAENPTEKERMQEAEERQAHRLTQRKK